MSRILTEENLVAYFGWRKKPWGVADLLYEWVPMLTVRNYISADSDRNWPLCWTSGRGLRRGLSVCIEFLIDWQAFRPRTAQSMRKALEHSVPRIVMRLQKRIVQKVHIRGIGDLDQKKADRLIPMMSRAVADVSALKRLKQATPMFGSKVMHFFFPDYLTSNGGLG